MRKKMGGSCSFS